MSDVHDAATRSRNMAAIRSVDTKPELTIRRGLHARGFRYKLHDKRLAGKPDLVLPRHHAVIFVHGCFWHGHDCHLFKWPRTRKQFWEAKIRRNQSVDEKAITELRQRNWRVLTVWECALKGRTRLAPDDVIDRIENWILSEKPKGIVAGHKEPQAKRA